MSYHERSRAIKCWSQNCTYKTYNDQNCYNPPANEWLDLLQPRDVTCFVLGGADQPFPSDAENLSTKY